MSNRRQALSRARQYRTCPPGKVAQDRRYAENVKRHFAVCPHCSGQEPKMPDPWEEIGRQISPSADSPSVSKEPIFAGGLYYLNPDRACWRGDYYYNAPMVLVLAFPPGIDDAVTVAQSYHELCLAGPGDLILNNSQTGCGDLFVECWNTYTVGTHDLGTPVGHVPNEVVKAVLAAGENPDDLPEWAPLTRVLTDQDVRIYFRELEVECGFTFGAPAVAGLLHQFEKPAIELLGRSVEDLKAELVRKTPGLHWPVIPNTLEQVLALARYPDEMLPLAAAPDDTTCFHVKLVQIAQNTVDRIRPLIAEILLKQETENSVTISGRIIAPPDAVQRSHLLVFWPDYNQRPLQPLKTKWDPSSANFIMMFAKTRRLPGTWAHAPAMALVCDSGREK